MGESEILSGTSLQSYTTHFLDLFAKFHTLILITGWRRLIGSPKLQIILHKRATKYRSLLRKMTYKDNGSYESSPPCTHTHSQHTHTLNTHTLSTHTHSQHTHILICQLHTHHILSWYLVNLAASWFSRMLTFFHLLATGAWGSAVYSLFWWDRLYSQAAWVGRWVVWGGGSDCEPDSYGDGRCGR